MEAKRAAAKTCYNLVNNQYINDSIVVDEVLISLLMRKHFETDYLFKHTVVKTLDCAVKECIELKKEELMIRIIKKYQSLSFTEWIINSIGCDNVQIIVLKVFIATFVRSKNENAQFVDTLISQASSKYLKMEGEKRTINPLMYIPLAHKHHYDIDTALIGQTIPFQPSSNDTQKRLKELVLQKYSNTTPSNSPLNRRRSNSGFSFGTRSSSMCSTHSPVILMGDKFSSNNCITDESIFSLGSTGEFGLTVQSNIKKTQKKDSSHSPTPTVSLLEMWQDEYGTKEILRETNFKSFRTGSSSSTLPHINSMSTSTTPIPHQTNNNRSHAQRPASALSYSKPRKEVTDLNPELERRYLNKSKEMGIIKQGTTFPFENLLSSKYKQILK
ncbi:predicted protein [Naegleria gruberi]|uniref:Predicted protein n=1 Tax=Naegleria gruberi TaxID=5762 RepID=D2VX99_NAEGR|nr:uncharacterized protein NAEGRDRAFT_52981 [Naegleria gruberi]EFC38589.1 predicted protein [Naegleria gruberi]|eukprot:XP_002671333.1 predicted protein [Naegleria gruberi strain NEG-M]